jgi:heat shock protein 1/8
MVDEAAKHSEDDRIAKEKIEARNGLDSYVHQVKKAVNDEKLAGKVTQEDKKEVETAVSEVQQWLEKNLSAEKEEIEHQRKEFEKKVTPIMTKIYQGAQGGEGGMPNFNQGGFGGEGGMPNFNQGGFGGQQPPQGGSGGSSSSGPKIEEVD